VITSDTAGHDAGSAVYHHGIPAAPHTFPEMLRFLPVCVIFTLAAPAYAGFDCDDEPAIKSLEAFAKDKSQREQVSWLCVELGAEHLKPRIEKACKKILDRDGEKNNECVVAAAAAGFGKLGDHDIFALVGKLPEDPIEFAGGIGFSKAELYERIGDPRGAQILTEAWKQAMPRADVREKRHRSMVDWSSWRQHTAKALGGLGDADTRDFLEAQAKATKDTHVRDACITAAQAIVKRLTPR
jgi:HEAT repeat protein